MWGNALTAWRNGGYGRCVVDCLHKEGTQVTTMVAIKINRRMELQKRTNKQKIKYSCVNHKRKQILRSLKENDTHN